MEQPGRAGADQAEQELAWQRREGASLTGQAGQQAVQAELAERAGRQSSSNASRASRAGASLAGRAGSVQAGQARQQLSKVRHGRQGKQAGRAGAQQRKPEQAQAEQGQSRQGSHVRPLGVHLESTEAPFGAHLGPIWSPVSRSACVRLCVLSSFLLRNVSVCASAFGCFGFSLARLCRASTIDLQC